MSAIIYSQLALNWTPETKNNKQFLVIAGISVTTFLLVAFLISNVNVPEQKRQARIDVPERIANFILEKEKPKPVPKIKPRPKPKPKAKARVKAKPKVNKQPIKDVHKKPLTKTQKKAREKAANSGLLALGNELADLMDTEDVTTMLGGAVKVGKKLTLQANNSSKKLLLADAGKGSEGVNVSEYSTKIKSSKKLTQREITQVKQALISPEVRAKTHLDSRKSKSNASNKPRTAGVRGEEGITVVFDQNKSKLYSLYNRARRKDPGLKGKIVLELTVAPSGKVIRIKVISNDLNNSKLESRIVSRVKQFNFGAQNVEEITITYPIEFLPS